MAFKLKDIVPWGRSFAEYEAMFALKAIDLEKDILGCADGPASFNYQMAKIGRKVVSVDPVYCFTRKEIRSRITNTFEVVLRQVKENMDDVVWDHIRSVEELGEVRRAAMECFLSDYDSGKSEGRYVCGSLPELQFDDRQFDIALCSHFLFLYSSHLSVQNHIDSIKELCRVAQEVRIFPILELGSKISRHFDAVSNYFREAGYVVETRFVDYEFQKGGNQMMKIHYLDDRNIDT